MESGGGSRLADQLRINSLQNECEVLAQTNATLEAKLQSLEPDSNTRISFFSMLDEMKHKNPTMATSLGLPEKEDQVSSLDIIRVAPILYGFKNDLLKDELRHAQEVARMNEIRFKEAEKKQAGPPPEAIQKLKQEYVYLEELARKLWMEQAAGEERMQKRIRESHRDAIRHALDEVNDVLFQLELKLFPLKIEGDVKDLLAEAMCKVRLVITARLAN
jgi:hypothetical protein